MGIYINKLLTTKIRTTNWYIPNDDYSKFLRLFYKTHYKLTVHIKMAPAFSLNRHGLLDNEISFIIIVSGVKLIKNGPFDESLKWCGYN